MQTPPSDTHLCCQGQGQPGSHRLPESRHAPQPATCSLQTDRPLPRGPGGIRKDRGQHRVVGVGGLACTPGTHASTRGQGWTASPPPFARGTRPTSLHTIPTCSDAAQTAHRGSHPGGVQGCQHRAQGRGPHPHPPPDTSPSGTLCPQSRMRTHTHITRVHWAHGHRHAGDGQAEAPPQSSRQL